jgi:hypothetical protein
VKFTAFQYFGTTMGQMVDGKMIYTGITINGDIETENPPYAETHVRPQWRGRILVSGLRVGRS